MKLRTAVAAFVALVASVCVQNLHAEQNAIELSRDGSTFTTKHGGAPSLNNIINIELNPAMRALATNSYGSSCSAISSPYPYQWCVDATQRKLFMYSAPASTPTVFSWHPVLALNGDGTFALPSVGAISTPSSVSLGGVFAATAPSNQFQTGINNSGAPIFAQPAFTNLSGSLACAQRPALTGDVTATAGSCSTAIAANAVTNGKIANAAVDANKLAPGAVVTSLGFTPLASIPAPGALALGGIFSASAPTNQVQTGVDTLGNPVFALPTFANLGLSPLSRTLLDRERDSVHLEDYCSSTLLNTDHGDVTACFGAAINQAVLVGSCLELPPLPAGIHNYAISSTIVIGNGTVFDLSTVNNICIRGKGSAGLYGSYGTYFVWKGADGGTMMLLQGPMNNVNFQGFNLVGNYDRTTGHGAGHILTANSVRWWRMHDVYMSACSLICLDVEGMNTNTLPATTIGNVSTAVVQVEANYTFSGPLTAQVDYNVQYVTLTASRTVTLPAASSVANGRGIIVGDSSGQASVSKKITGVRAGSDTISGGTTSTTVVINSANGQFGLQSNGTNTWTVVPATSIIPNVMITGTGLNFELDWERVYVSTNADNADTVKFDGFLWANTDTWHSSIKNSRFEALGTTGATALHLAMSDNITFNQLHAVANPGNCGVKFDAMSGGSGGNSFPTGHTFIKSAINSTCVIEDLTHTIGVETFWDFGTTDNEVIPTHPSLRGITDQAQFFGNFGNVGSFLCGSRKGVSMGTTFDQALTITPPSVNYSVSNVRVMNPSAALTAAQGGIYTGTSKSGVPILAATTSYTGLTTNAANSTGNLALFGATNAVSLNLTTLYLSLTTAESSAKTADVYVYCVPMP